MYIKSITIEKVNQTGTYSIKVDSTQKPGILDQSIQFSDLSGTNPTNIPFYTFDLSIIKLSVFLGKIPVPPPLSDGLNYTPYIKKENFNAHNSTLIGVSNIETIKIEKQKNSPYYSVELNYSNIPPILLSSINPRIMNPSDNTKNFPRFVDILLEASPNSNQSTQLNTKFYLEEELAFIARKEANSLSHPYIPETPPTNHFSAHFVIKLHH